MTDATATDATTTDAATLVERRIAQVLEQAPPATSDAPTFARARFDAGLAWVWFPEGHGGLGVERDWQGTVESAFRAAHAPEMPSNVLGTHMAAPTIVDHGTEAQRSQWLRRIYTSGEIWCQLFSEPGAGSDLGGLATRAERDGDTWIVNGQKVWTTSAFGSKWGLLVARTDPDAPKHRGISFFIIDMEQPGVEVRPLVQITGDAEFNEVFFNDARVRNDWMLGREGDGWKVAITTLMNERISLSGAGSIGGDSVGGSPIDRLLDRHRGITDPLARQQLAGAYIESRLIRLNNQRAADKRKSGAEAGPEGSITKLMQAEFNQRLQKLALDLEGPDGVAWEGVNLSKTTRSGRSIRVDDDATVAFGFLRAQANTIEGGTSDIMRNILGERVLGLPKDPDSSRELPWSEVPRSG